MFLTPMHVTGTELVCYRLLVGLSPVLRSSVPGMVVQKVFRIRICTFIQANRIAFAFRIRIAFFALFFFEFSLFFDLFASCFTVSAPKTSKKCEKNGKKVQKMLRKRKKCKMRMQCENGIKICIASHCTITAKNSHFCTFLHRICIALPSLMLCASQALCPARACHKQLSPRLGVNQIWYRGQRGLATGLLTATSTLHCSRDMDPWGQVSSVSMT